MATPYDACNLGPPQSLVTPILAANFDPASSPTTTTVTVAGLPVGTKAISGYFVVTSNAANHYVIIRQYGLTVNRTSIRTQVANVPVHSSYIVRVDSSFRFDVLAENSGIFEILIFVTEYYMGG